MSENINKFNLSGLFKVSASLCMFFLILLITTTFKNKEHIQNTSTTVATIPLIDDIVRAESLLAEIDQIQNNLGKEKKSDLISKYNKLSDLFNTQILTMAQQQVLQEDPLLKNQVIATNNKAIEFINFVKDHLSSQQKNEPKNLKPLLTEYSELKKIITQVITQNTKYNSATALFTISLSGFILFSMITILLAALNFKSLNNDLFQISSQLATFKSIINNMSEGVVVTNQYGFFTYYNQSAIDIIGSNINDIHYQSSIDLIGFHDSQGLKMDKIALPFYTALQKNTTSDQEIKVVNSIHPEGIYISASNGYYVDQRGETAGSVVVMKNITHQKQLEALWLKEKESAIEGSKKKSDFLASMSHEIRTPMNGIIGLTTLLNETPLNPEQKDYVGTVKRSAESLLSLINDILDHSKIEAGKIELVSENFNLKLLVKDIKENFKFICAEKNIEMRITYPDTIADYFVGDGHRLRQILMNLIGNAVKFTSAGSVELKLLAKNKMDLRFEITDTGAGMEPHEVERLFQRFFQTKSGLKFGGTGLGLSISKQLVDLMNGAIGVTSVVNKGSTFWFEINLKEGYLPKTNDIKPTLAHLENIFNGSILIAEDNLVNQKVASQYLKKLGFSVDVTNNGQEAVAQFKQKKYDLVFMDCQMPIMNGYQATKEILELQSREAKCVPIVALTAEGTSGEKAKCFAAGMNEFLNKPLVFDELARLLNKYFSTSPEVSEMKPEIMKLSEIKVGDQLLLEILLDDYRNSSPALIATMKTAFANKNTTELSNAAHTLKSASATLSALKVSELCQKLEDTTAFTETPALALLISDLETAYVRSLGEIQKTIIEIQSQHKGAA